MLSKRPLRILLSAALCATAAACDSGSPVDTPGAQNSGPTVRVPSWSADSALVGVRTSAVWASIHGSSPTDVYAVADSGYIARFDGTRWVAMQTPTRERLMDVWVTGPGTAFAVGQRGTVLRLSNGVWTDLPIPAELLTTETDGALANLGWVWAASPSVVYASTGKVLLFFDGTAWTRLKVGLTSISGIHGTGPNNVYVVGNDGVVAHFDGANWDLYRTGVDPFSVVYAPDPSTVLVGGSNVLLRSTGGAFQPLAIPGFGSGDGVRDIGGTSANDLWVLTSLARYIYDGQGWTRIANPVSLFGLNRLYVTGPSTAFFTGFSSAGLWEDAGGVGGPVFGSRNIDYSGLTTTTPGNVFASSSVGIWKVNGERWARFGYAGATRAIAGAPDGSLFALTSDNRVIRYSGSTWETSTSLQTGNPPGSQGTALHAWSGGTAVAVGQNGLAAHFDGSAWKYVETGTRSLLSGVWGSSPAEVFAVGVNGLVMRYNGTSWTAMQNTGTAYHLSSVWGTSATNVFAVGQWGTIVRYDGTSWTPMRTNTFAHLTHVHGTGPNDVLAVGDEGVVLHFNGTSWKDVSSPRAHSALRAVQATGATSGVTVGPAGTVYYNR
jgi:hypothetical protein